MTEAAKSLEHHVQGQLGAHLLGMEQVIHALCIAAVARGHVLLEGPPGLGKTRLSRGFAAVMGGSFKRIQGTADLLPADITGVHIFNRQSQVFEFQPGPLFADLVLVDEVNRAGPKTQSALLEAMEERQVSVDRETFALNEEFLVIATMNPREYEGTFPLPESQLDRFALSVPITYLDREDEYNVLSSYNLPGAGRMSPESITPLSAEQLGAARENVEQVHLSEELIHYAQDIAAATRSSTTISLGLSVRGALALVRAARVEAALRGADFVVPDDVKTVARWVVAHRLQLSAEAALDGLTAEEALSTVLEQVAVPR